MLLKEVYNLTPNPVAILFILAHYPDSSRGQMVDKPNGDSAGFRLDTTGARFRLIRCRITHTKENSRRNPSDELIQSVSDSAPIWWRAVQL